MITCDVVELVQGLPPVVPHLHPDGNFICSLQVREDECPDDAVADHEGPKTHMGEQVSTEQLHTGLHLGKGAAILLRLVVQRQALPKQGAY